LCFKNNFTNSNIFYTKHCIKIDLKNKILKLYHYQMKTARIYKIVNTKTVDIYVGSTIRILKDRFK